MLRATVCTSPWTASVGQWEESRAWREKEQEK